MYARGVSVILAGLCLLAGLRTGRAATTTISLSVITNSCKFSEAGVDLGSTWRQPSYDDSGWTNHKAIFYTDSGNPPANANTLLALGPSSYYFRVHFTQNSTSTLASLSSTCVLDDGAVLYLNGTEVLRVGMPTGVIGYATLATRSVGNGVSEVFSIPPTNLVVGDNVMAVELHQAAGLADAAFGFALNETVTYTTNTAQRAIVLNEVLANTHLFTNADGFAADWVELYNPSTGTVDLSDMSLSTSAGSPRKWVFPSGSTLASHGYRVIEFNNDYPSSPSNTGFTISGGSDSVYLFDRPSNGGILVDAVHFGPQAADYSIGRAAVNSTNWVLDAPSRGTTNTPATFGNSALLKINEWLAHSTALDGDWLELYNPDTKPVMLSGLYLVKGPLPGTTIFTLPALSFLGIGGNGYVQYHADKGTALDHVSFMLTSAGDTISILASNGTTVIDSLTYGNQTNNLDVSEGRFTDGATNIVVFTDSTSPGEANWLPLTNTVINEVLSHTDPPVEDAVELYNPTAVPTDIGGWFLSNSLDDLKKYRIPSGTFIQPGGFYVIYETQFNTTNGGTVAFTFNSAHGDSCHLSVGNAQGNLTGYRTKESFGSAANGVSFGTHQTSVGVDFTAMSETTFGEDTPSDISQFRVGTGSPNNYPSVGPIVINEIMYHPPSTVSTNDNTQDEFIELLNVTTGTVPLYDVAFPTNQWEFNGGVNFTFPSNRTLTSNACLLVVPFDPATNPTALATFRSKYNVATNIAVYGPYSGKLKNTGESLELYRPDTPQAPPHPDAGYVPYILVDKIHYSNLTPWPTSADAGGTSLQRRNPLDYGNDPANWAAVATTAGRSNGLTVLTPPSIVLPPQSLNVHPSGSAGFGVQANGSAPLHFKWMFNGSTIPSATNCGLMVTNARTTNAGFYTVIVTNWSGATTSAPATLNLITEFRLVPQMTPSNGGMALTISPSISQAYTLEVSSNLVTWTTLFTNLTGSSASDYVQTSLSGWTHRFFRGKQWP